MGWALLDDGFCNHPKVVDLIFHPTADGPRAMAYWTMALSWAYRYTINKPEPEQGVIPPGQLRAWGRLMSREGEAAEALADVGLWDRLDGGAYRIHDFREWARLDQRDAKVRGGRMTAKKRWGTELPLGLNSSPDDDASSTPTDGANSSATSSTDSTATSKTGSELVTSDSDSDSDKSKPSAIADGEFDKFWTTYPKRKGKQAALKAWIRIVKAVSPSVIIAGAAAYAEQRDGQDPKFTAHPATWLNAGCWDDEDDDDTPTERFIR